MPAPPQASFGSCSPLSLSARTSTAVASFAWSLEEAARTLTLILALTLALALTLTLAPALTLSRSLEDAADVLVGVASAASSDAAAAAATALAPLRAALAAANSLEGGGGSGGGGGGGGGGQRSALALDASLFASEGGITGHTYVFGVTATDYRGYSASATATVPAPPDACPRP